MAEFWVSGLLIVISCGVLELITELRLVLLIVVTLQSADAVFGCCCTNN